jgi:hypothetical protein
MVNVSNLGFGGSGIPDAMPQAIAELQGLTLSVITGAAAGTVMPVTGMDPEDHLGGVVNLTDLESVDVATCTVSERNASATITCLTTAADGDTVVVNGKTYTFKDVVVHTSYNTPPYVVPTDITPSGSDPEEMASRLATAIMSGDSTLTATVGPNADSPPLQAVVTVKVRSAGTAGNAYTLTETGGAVTVSGATFSGGTAEGSAGFTCTSSLAAKKVLVLWYDKHPGVATAPLMAEGPGLLKAMRFRAGRQEPVEGERGDEGREGEGRGDEPDKSSGKPSPNPKPNKPGPGR